MIKLRFYDTSLFMAHVRHEKNKFGRSNKLMSDISDGKAILVIPMIQVLECIDAIRRHVPRESKQRDMSANDVKKKIAQTTVTFVDFFTLQEKANHAIVLRTHGHADEYFLKVYEKLQKYPIQVVRSGRRYKYRGMGFVDLAYMYYAKAAGVKTVHTWDKGFLQAKEDPEFDSIDVIVLDEADYA